MKPISSLLALSIIGLFPTILQANDSNLAGVGQGILCDTLIEAQRIVTLLNEGKETQSAIAAATGDAATPGCNVVMVQFVERQPLVEMILKGRVVSIEKLTVHAVMLGPAWKQVAPTVQYTIVPGKDHLA